MQNQLLACLQWLGGSQVLACIPLSGSVPSKDVADLAGVSEKQLCRVVRMTATAGFLHEPQPGHIAHTALSAPFVTTPSLLDAAMFLSETAAPAALQMAVAAHHFGYPPWPDQSTYNVVLNTSSTFASIIKQRPKLHRQWAAYQRYGMGDTDASVIEVLTGLDWLSLGNASIVDVSPHILHAVCLNLRSPRLTFCLTLGWSAVNYHSNGTCEYLSSTCLHRPD